LFVANSSLVADRIRRYYGRSSVTVFPPVDTVRFAPQSRDEDYYVVVARLIPYKRVDLAVEAFNQTGHPLVVIGDGPDRSALQRMARPNIRFLGRVSDEELADFYARCRGLVLPGEEDFGIAPLEANAAGRPVIALRAGGALDTVQDGRTGIFFDRQTPEALADAVGWCDGRQWDKVELRRHAETFAEPVFQRRMLEVIERVLGSSGRVASGDRGASAGAAAANRDPATALSLTPPMDVAPDDVEAAGRHLPESR
jgi:glycosyltransferase involved in cell wall biosynthesis